MTKQDTTGAYHLLLAGVDTLVLNVRYSDEDGRPLKRELADELVEQFNAWQEEAKREEGQVVTPLCFKEKNLFIYPHGAGKGQWRWLLTCPDFTLSVSRGRLSGIIAQVRFSSEFLWRGFEDSPQDFVVAMVAVMDFLHDVFGENLHFQVSEVHLCADVLGWDVSSCSWQDTFLSRARRRVDRAGSDDEQVTAGGAAVAVVSGRKLATLEFGSHGSPLSCVIYDKTLEIKQKSYEKVWFHDLWRRVKRADGTPVWDGEAPVWRVEFRFKREALHELKEEGVFHGIEEANDLPERLAALWTYAAGHFGGAADGLPDGWLRYALPVADSNMARWPVHPVWALVQTAFCEHTSDVIDTATGEVLTVPLVATGEVIRERVRQVNIGRLVKQIGGCLSTLAAWLGGLLFQAMLHWLQEEIARYVLPLAALKVSPEHPELLHKKFTRKFTEDVRSKGVLYGLQAAA
jgi:hypothetical protein